MKLISLNIELNKHHETVLPFLKEEKADIVCLQELLEEDFSFYKKELDLPGIFQSCDYVRSAIYQKMIGKRQGVAIFSRNIAEGGSIFYLGKEEDVLKPFDKENFEESEALVWADTVNEDGMKYRFVTAHLPVTKNGESTPSQLAQLDALLAELAPLGEFTLCGDMNAPRGNETFRRMEERYKDNIPLEYKTSIDQNLHRTKGIQFMVDCLFTTPNYETSEVKLVDGLSDHMAIVADIIKIN